MKRSEVLEEIERLLWHTKYIDMPYVPSGNFTLLSVEILNKIEEIGMLPPIVCEEKTINEGTDDEYYVYAHNDWEKE